MIVADAGPLIAFSRIGRLDLLREVLGEIIIPGAVYEETATKGRGRAGTNEITRSAWIHRQTVEDPTTVLAVLSTLHRGELEAIALARHIGAQLLIDERRGREAAQAHGVEVIGSLAVLAEAKRRGLVARVRPLLGALMTSGYWMDADLVRAFLAEVGESEDVTQ